MPVRKRSTIIAMVGPVGSGKTYVARRLARRLGAMHLRTDDIRRRLAQHGKPISRAIAISDLRRDRALLRGHSVILDFDAARPKKQRELAALAKRHGARIYFVQVRAKEPVILARLRAQRYPIPGVFNSVKHALLVYFSRKHFHRRPLRCRPLFVIDNSGKKPLGREIARVVERIKGP